MYAFDSYGRIKLIKLSSIQVAKSMRLGMQYHNLRYIAQGHIFNSRECIDMFMIIGVKNDRVAVLDTSDNVVEVYKKSEVISIARSGIEIKGVDANSGVVDCFMSVNEYVKRIVNKLNLVSGERFKIEGADGYCILNKVSGTYKSKEVKIPYGVAILGQALFEHNENLRCAYLPETIIRIESEAFYKCCNLSKINIPDGVDYIGYNAFQSTSLTEVVLPSDLESFDAGAFAGCTQLRRVTSKDKLDKISESAFTNCEALSCVDIRGVKLVESSAFADCPNLRSFSSWGTVKNIGYGSFTNCTGLRGGISLYSIVFINGNAFSGCNNLNEVRLGRSLNEMEVSAFTNCTNLSNVFFNVDCSLESIPSYCFYNSGLEELILPPSVEKLGYMAFANCKKLSSVSFGENCSLRSISNCSFQNSGLEELILPPSIKRLGYMAFANCNKLKRVVLEYKDVTHIIEDLCFADCANLECVELRGVVEMQKGIFKGCTRLKELFIDDIRLAKSLDLSAECPSILKYRTLTGVYNKDYKRI